VSNVTSQDTNNRPPLCAPTLHEDYLGAIMGENPLFLSNFVNDVLLDEISHGNRVLIIINPNDEIVKQFEEKSAKTMLITDIDDILPF